MSETAEKIVQMIVGLLFCPLVLLVTVVLISLHLTGWPLSVLFDSIVRKYREWRSS